MFEMFGKKLGRVAGVMVAVLMLAAVACGGTTATHAYAGRRSYRGGRGRRGDRGEAKEIEREPKRLRETV